MNDAIRVRVQEGRKYGIIWFGAAISLAEIEAGFYCGSHFTAVLLGHLLGGILLFLAALTGARTHRNGMGCTERTFGLWGMRFFAVCNVLQLIGWTAVMLSQGANAAQCLLPNVPFWLQTAVLALLVTLWLFIGLRSFSWISTLTMLFLLAVMAALSLKLLQQSQALHSSVTSFRDVFELSLAMPLSWLPLIPDYTRDSKAPIFSSTISAGVYTIGSIWMYTLGMALATMGTESIANGILATGMGFWALVIVLVSTTTTTFLDAYSAGESACTLHRKLHPKTIGSIVCALGFLLAIWGIMDRYTEFLYLISSLFAPMSIVMLTAHFLGGKNNPICNTIAFLTGFGIYHVALHTQFSPLGPSMTAMAAAFVVTLILSRMPAINRTR